MLDHLAVMQELSLILRGEHPAWGGDSRRNGYLFLRRIINDMPDEAALLGKDLLDNTSDVAEESGISPSTVELAGRILMKRTDGPL